MALKLLSASGGDSAGIPCDLLLMTSPWRLARYQDKSDSGEEFALLTLSCAPMLVYSCIIWLHGSTSFVPHYQSLVWALSVVISHIAMGW